MRKNGFVCRRSVCLLFSLLDYEPAAISAFSACYGTNLTIRWNTVGFSLALICAFLIVLYGIVHAHTVVPVHYAVTVGERRKPYRVILLSDVHPGIYNGANHLANVAEADNAVQPDLVVIAGTSLMPVRPEPVLIRKPQPHSSGVFRHRTAWYWLLGIIILPQRISISAFFAEKQDCNAP